MFACESTTPGAPFSSRSYNSIPWGPVHERWCGHVDAETIPFWVEKWFDGPYPPQVYPNVCWLISQILFILWVWWSMKSLFCSIRHPQFACQFSNVALLRLSTEGCFFPCISGSIPMFVCFVSPVFDGKKGLYNPKVCRWKANSNVCGLTRRLYRW